MKNIYVTGKNLLAFGVLWFAGSLVAQAESRTALLIGVWDYSEASFNGRATPSLPGIKNDLQLMKKALESCGFSVKVVQKPTSMEAENAVDIFGRSLKSKGGVGLFYFSGHGGEYRGNNYLIPRKASIGTAAHLKQQALNAQRVLDWMEDSRTRVNLVFLDCCRTDLSPSKSLRGSNIAKMGAGETFIGFATRSGDEIDSGSQSSPYTRFLAKNIQIPGISVGEMHRRVIGEVQEYSSRTTGQKRRPGSYSELSEEFFFVPKSNRSNSNNNIVFTPLHLQNAQNYYSKAKKSTNSFESRNLFKKAAESFRKSAEAGEVMGLAWMGHIYENGEGVEANRDEAIKWYVLAGAKGNQHSIDAAKRLGKTPDYNALLKELDELQSQIDRLE